MPVGEVELVIEERLGDGMLGFNGCWSGDPLARTS